MTPNMQERTALILKEQELKPVELARIAGVTKGLVSQWLNGPAKSMSYSAAKRINAKYGYAIDWLVSGAAPKMSEASSTATVSEPVAEYNAVGPEAMEVARLWLDLSPNVRGWIRDLIFMTRLAERRYPWLRRGRPKSETYNQWETRMEQNFKAMTALELRRQQVK